MYLSITFIRLLFVALCTLISTTYAAAEIKVLSLMPTLLIGAACGMAFSGLVISFDWLFKRINLRAFNIATIGLFFGYLMGEAILLVFQTAFDFSGLKIAAPLLTVLQAIIFLSSCYLGMMMTARTSEELYMSIPFIKFKQTSQKKKDLLLDASAVLDPRLLDLAATGLLDQQLIVPRFLVKELEEQAEVTDENTRAKARRSLDILIKLENLPALELRFTDTSCSEIKDPSAKILRLARLLDANILTAEMTRTNQQAFDGLQIINFNTLSHALKPVSQTGELLNIKIQRYGKEPRQGVGYLDDGTMVVVNGGAEFIGETIRTQVLSVKHTASGRMIFCNALEGEMENEPTLASSSTEGETMASSYFAH